MEWIDENLLILGDTHGDLSLFDFRKMSVVDSLSISNQTISNVSFQNVVKFQTPIKRRRQTLNTPSSKRRNPTETSFKVSEPQVVTNPVTFAASNSKSSTDTDETVKQLSSDLNDFRSDVNADLKTIKLEIVKLSFNQDELIQYLFNEIKELKEEIKKLK
jgi:hypothetical protein